MSQAIEVVGAVIVRDGLVYCVQRGPDRSLPGLWEFPGGKIEPGEEGPIALAREIEEELLCRVEVGEIVTYTSHDYDFGTVRLTTYYCQLVDEEPSLSEHSSERWLSSEELGQLLWAPADVPAVAEIVRRFTATATED